MKLMKRILAAILALSTLVALMAVPASAASVLRYGSRGTEVEALQSALNAVADENLAEDGVFGRDTQAAVKRFQRASGLTEDGVVGRKTWNALRDALDALEDVEEAAEDSLFASTTSKVITYSLRKSGKVKLTDNFRVREFACNDGSNTVLVDRKLVRYCRISEIILAQLSTSILHTAPPPTIKKLAAAPTLTTLRVWRPISG